MTPPPPPAARPKPAPTATPQRLPFGAEDQRDPSRSATPAVFATARGGGRRLAWTPTPRHRISSRRRRPPAPARRIRRRSRRSPLSSAWWASARRWCSSSAAGCAARSASARRRGRLCCSWRFPQASSTPPDPHSLASKQRIGGEQRMTGGVVDCVDYPS